ncbi:hypothetical protein GOC91_22485 [Sinorhizobium medicae]|uniref:Uncharacterized protein n=2 Tax=Sinorhizobium medicae TaxID=110321 RepID=A6UAY8_SINMW|nr:hypothetical protein [Sinorhizobium medicae]ABR60818.1 conserved hypothetical protein [Sinorhizobium medicae WSM419]MBO1943863.1 hypothetical protein [Sinorhizobium medicae]MBO1964941.1 hypothetical protein [Sinorhizobium medicae]MDX0406976.1 hypothetical protein [Sinorhizobium medicae]MDX0418686.1 hypothetical protein [Sinorhizobium medicae]
MTPAERPCDETIRRALARVLDSKGFQRSERLRTFLSYVVEKEIIGEGAQLKGYSIAIDVFGRGQTFNADSDPLVRVHAGKLRKLLKAFYETDGAGEEWQIAIPKGTYVPEYRRCSNGVEALPGPDAAGARRRQPGRGPPWQPAPFSSPWAVLTVLPLLLFAPLPASEMSLDIDAEAKLVNGPMAAVRGLPSVSISVTGSQHRSTRRFSSQLRDAALRHGTLAQAHVSDGNRTPASGNQALAFSIALAWHDAPAAGIRVTLSHDGEGIPLRQDFISADRLDSEADVLYESTSLAAKLFSLDGEIYAHAALEGLQSTMMQCMSATAKYRKLLTRDSFQQAWNCQQKLKPLKGDEPFFILSVSSPHKINGH